jgi:hypothetical protein
LNRVKDALSLSIPLRNLLWTDNSINLIPRSACLFRAEFDMEWPSEEPDLRALVAAAQKKVPDLVHRPSCAVVGNSGRLLQHEHGAEIDSKELVIRFNWGTVSVPSGFTFLDCALFLGIVFSERRLQRTAQIMFELDGSQPSEGSVLQSDCGLDSVPSRFTRRFEKVDHLLLRLFQ